MLPVQLKMLRQSSYYLRDSRPTGLATCNLDVRCCELRTPDFESSFLDSIVNIRKITKVQSHGSQCIISGYNTLHPVKKIFANEIPSFSCISWGL